MSSLTVLCPNKRRVTVKVAPNTRMQEVLSEASKKQGFVSDQYNLNHQNKSLDPTLSFRLSGLPNNCTLEMVPNPTAGEGPKIVEIALQLSVGGRHMKKLSNDMTLAQVLESFETEVGLDLLSPEGELMQPTVAHMNTEVIGVLQLSSTTLQSLGINQGRELLRYSSRVVKEEKMKLIEQSIDEMREKEDKLDKTFEENRIKNEQREQLEIVRQQEFEAEMLRQKEEAAAAISNDSETPMEVSEVNTDTNSRQPETPSVTGGPNTNRLGRLNELLTQVNESLDSSGEIPWQLALNQGRVKLAQMAQDAQNMEFADFKFPEPSVSTARSQLSATTSESEISSAPTCERQAIVYEVEGMGFDQLRETPDTQFFDVTQSDVRVMQQSLKEISDSYTQAALVPARVVAQRNAQRKQNAWKHTVIRVLFPNKLVLQLCFLSQEKVSQLYAAVLHCLTGVKKFSLSVPPNLAVEESNSKSLIDANLAPGANLVIKVKEGQDSNPSLLNAVLVSQKISFGEAEIVSKEWLSSNSVYVPYRPTVSESKQQTNAQPVDYNKRQTADALSNAPKWFKGAKR